MVMEWARRIWRSLKWYERMITGAAALILISGALAWWFGERNVTWAVRVAEPAFMGLGALSIILLWAQLRVSNLQDEAENVWKRVVCYHNYFKELPQTARAEDLRKYFHELGIETPPSAYRPLDETLVEQIWADKGTAERPPGRVVISRYLSDWEDFCGAISVGVVDEEYAREMEGTRVISAFYGYRAAINKMRQLQIEESKARTAAGSAPPFANKFFLELQRIATRWHVWRSEELAKEQERIRKADEAADMARTSAGVPAKAWNHEGAKRGSLTPQVD